MFYSQNAIPNSARPYVTCSRIKSREYNSALESLKEVMRKLHAIIDCNALSGDAKVSNGSK